MDSLAILKALSTGAISAGAAREALKQLAVAPVSVKPGHDARATPEPIAIIGMSGRYPDAPDVQTYWNNLLAGKNAVREIPLSRWDVQSYYDPRPLQKGKVYCKWLGMLDDIAEFDPLFFSLSPGEAEWMDPQHRIFLQEAYKAFEDAGYPGEALNEQKCGVYLGIMSNEYAFLQHQLQPGIAGATGNSYSIAAARIAYFLNLKGPAIAVDTACSSSLVAIHLACQALRNGETDMALAGGVSLYLTPESYISMCSAGMLSKDGQCKAMDNSANGFVPGEGAGAVILKRLKDAEADNDNILGVIIGSGINQDGRTNGITAPSMNSQAALLRDVYAGFKIHPETISYIELHGTGTKLGDPIELEALSTVFRENTFRQHFCGLGSVKSNIGHTSAAAGVASVQKVLLSMHAHTLPPTLHVTRPNEHFKFEQSPFYICDTPREWNSDGKQRRAGISSFGFSGTNAHLVVEEYQPVLQTRPAESISVLASVFVLSAKTEEQLKVYAGIMRQFLEAHPTLNFTDLLYTLQVGRDAMEYRLAFAAAGIADAIGKLGSFLNGHHNGSFFTGQAGGQTTPVNANGATLSRLWANGASVDWKLFYEKVKPRRISLPTYPFAKEVYWINASVQQQPVTAYPYRIVHKTWQEQGTNEQRAFHGKVLVLATKPLLSLANEIKRQYNNIDIIDPVNSLPLADGTAETYTGLIDLTGCDDTAEQALAGIPLLQQLISVGNRPLTMIGATQGLEKMGRKASGQTGALRAGLFRMLQAEYRYLNAIHLDIEHDGNAALQAAQILSELSVAGTYPEICFRDGKRYRAVLTASTPDKTRNMPAFPSGGVLLVTGGTRGIGLECARYFIKKYGVRKLVLTGREPLPPEEQWSVLLQSDFVLSRKLKAIQALRAEGVTVLVRSVVLNDETAVNALLTEIRTTLGDISGVLHCAGMVDLGNPAFIRKSVHSIREVLVPKVTGLQTLFQSLSKDPLQFFVLFSSVAGTVPTLGAGQSDYAMANAYMDYFAAAAQASFPVVSIQWPSWKETGFGEVKSPAYQQTGLISHSNADGLLLLEQVISGAYGPVVLPAMVDTSRFKPETWLEYPQKVVTEPLPAAPVAVPSMNKDDLMTVVETWLMTLLAAELRMDVGRLRRDKEFQIYGVDSIILAQLVSKIDRQFETIHLDPSVFLEYPTIAGMGAYLLDTYPNEMASLQVVKNNEPVAENVPVSYTKKRVAIVGMACHFPDAEDISAYWKNLQEGKDSIREVPISRWDWRQHYDPLGQQQGRSRSKWGAFLPEIEAFDPAVFNIAPALAPYIDPIQRQWLEVSTAAIADAGYEKDALWGKQIGVFAGARAGNFAYKYNSPVKDRIVGTGQNFITAHLAHIYNFKGPNIVVDTACSSTLTAVHLAVKSILSGESEMALAGGVDILLDEGVFIGLSDAGVLSKEGRCRTFDADADGIGLGEGCGVLVLKPLDAAIRDNNKIYGVIDGSAINNDGNTMGVTTPNPEAQRSLIAAAMENAGVLPSSVSYVETHGTGTLIGDPIELKALTQLFAQYTDRKQYCGVGSVKSNIGHLLSAAGAASIVKVLLSIVHAQLPPTLHCDHPNPRFSFDASPFYPVRELQAWNTSDGIRRAGISSFGLGGNNAHLIISNEGVPASHIATLQPRLNPIQFNRKRYWPEVTVSNSHQHISAPVSETLETAAVVNDFMKLFEVKEV
ncbi:polyketide synthase PksJ [Chitinophaga sp. YR627]|uniref:beta-ketoacyl synthase N-terminal-like domain-containing protein n=1 Tax=Chitinophaga sp. YR627 TaxID=1881041 RepID=UPI0008E8F1B8|nr:beta-ketoacyl synthase N-terminal-like domain-containing protein [Chitinophaga sp. YR627]SFM59219.1 polyketide synthase PksJ [Chitinophaga sp. YR627]